MDTHGHMIYVIFSWQPLNWKMSYTGNMNQHQGLSVNRTKLHLGFGIPIKSLMKIKTIRTVSKLSQICEYKYFTEAALCLPIT